MPEDPKKMQLLDAPDIAALDAQRAFLDFQLDHEATIYRAFGLVAPCRDRLDPVSLALRKILEAGRRDIEKMMFGLVKNVADQASDSEPKFKVGDLVTRDGTDVQRVLEVDDDYFCIKVECIRAPLSGWCRVGEIESNLSRRYDYAGYVVIEKGAEP